MQLLRRPLLMWPFVSSIEYGILFLVQEDKHHKEPGGPKLIARAIAAVQSNAEVRRQTGLAEFDFKIMPGITMISTSLYSRVDASFSGYAHHRRSLQCINPTSQPLCRLSEGVRALDNSRTILL